VTILHSMSFVLGSSTISSWLPFGISLFYQLPPSHYTCGVCLTSSLPYPEPCGSFLVPSSLRDSLSMGSTHQSPSCHLCCGLSVILSPPFHVVHRIFFCRWLSYLIVSLLTFHGRRSSFFHLSISCRRQHLLWSTVIISSSSSLSAYHFIELTLSSTGIPCHIFSSSLDDVVSFHSSNIVVSWSTTAVSSFYPWPCLGRRLRHFVGRRPSSHFRSSLFSLSLLIVS